MRYMVLVGCIDGVVMCRNLRRVVLCCVVLRFYEEDKDMDGLE